MLLSVDVLLSFDVLLIVDVLLSDDVLLIKIFRIAWVSLDWTGMDRTVLNCNGLTVLQCNGWHWIVCCFTAL